MLEDLLEKSGLLQYFTGGWRSILVMVIAMIVFIMFYGYCMMLPLHELGHLIFAKASGGTMISYRIMRLTFMKRNGRVQVRIYSHQGSAGQCITCPREYTERKHPFLLEMLGGPMMDLTASLINFCIALQAAFPTPLFNDAFLIGALLSLANCAANAIPMKPWGIGNDGMNAYLMSKDRQAVKSWYATAHIFRQLQEGKAYQNIGEERYRLPEDADLKNDIIAYHKRQRCYYYMELKQWDRANECLEEIGLHCSRTEKRNLLSDKLFLTIRMGKDASEIETLYYEAKKLLKQNKYDLYWIRTRMAYELYRDPSEENRMRVKAELGKITANYPYEGEAAFHTRLVLG